MALDILKYLAATEAANNTAVNSIFTIKRFIKKSNQEYTFAKPKPFHLCSNQDCTKVYPRRQQPCSFCDQYHCNDCGQCVLNDRPCQLCQQKSMETLKCPECQIIHCADCGLKTMACPYVLDNRPKISFQQSEVELKSSDLLYCVSDKLFLTFSKNLQQMVQLKFAGQMYHRYYTSESWKHRFKQSSLQWTNVLNTRVFSLDTLSIDYKQLNFFLACSCLPQEQRQWFKTLFYLFRRLDYIGADTIFYQVLEYLYFWPEQLLLQERLEKEQENREWSQRLDQLMASFRN
jgi:hypothetical protein